MRCVLAHPEGIAAAQAWQLVDEELARAGVVPADERLKGEIAAQLQREGFFRCEGGLLRP